MQFIIRTAADQQNYRVEHFDSTEAFAAAALTDSDYPISDADTLLRLYVDTDRDAALFKSLQQIRDLMLADLDEVESRAEIYGLIYWLLDDNGIKSEGYSLEETADRLGDMDIASDSDQYGEIIFHLKDAVDRLYELELEEF